MAVLTVDDDVLIRAEKFAKKEDLSREEFVNRAIDIYLREKEFEELCAKGFDAWGRKMAEQGYTEEDVMEIIRKERRKK
ncbi:MAG: hypothetical protein LBU70_04010 [Chitinispirillales bacterium]|jgi:predicted transcriptional regulator|nr:hypothetical protein [Chitinispirillales bacterium]